MRSYGEENILFILPIEYFEVNDAIDENSLRGVQVAPSNLHENP